MQELKESNVGEERIKAISSIQYKTLQEISSLKENEHKFFEQLEKKDELLQQLSKELNTSLKSEKQLISKIETLEQKNDNLEKKYNALRYSKLAKVTYGYWGLRKKVKKVLKRK